MPVHSGWCNAQWIHHLCSAPRMAWVYSLPASMTALVVATVGR